VVDRAEVTGVLIEMPGRAGAFRDAAMPALNLRYLAALILVDGRIDFTAAQSLDRRHGDGEVAARMATVDVVHDPDQETGTGRDRAESARVTVTLASGEVRERFVGFVRGYPTHPMTDEQAEAKARELLGLHLDPDRVDAVIGACRHLDDLDRASDLVPLISR
jgi:2-methylcitrate dehydratase PrpD